MPLSEEPRAPGIDLATAPPQVAVQVSRAQFPARTKQAAQKIKDIRTDVTSIQFADKIMLTISQDGRLGHWVSFELAYII